MSLDAIVAFDEVYARKRIEAGLDDDNQFVAYADDMIGLETGPMPEALAKSHHYTFGMRSLVLLRSHMTPSSYTDLEVLLERYPDHVFEISVWASCLGDTPGRNAIIWEIRRY